MIITLRTSLSTGTPTAGPPSTLLRASPSNSLLQWELNYYLVPSEFPPFLVDCGISSISVTPDTAMAVHQTVLESEMMIAQGIEIEE